MALLIASISGRILMSRKFRVFNGIGRPETKGERQRSTHVTLISVAFRASQTELRCCSAVSAHSHWITIRHPRLGTSSSSARSCWARAPCRCPRPTGWAGCFLVASYVCFGRRRREEMTAMPPAANVIANIDKDGSGRRRS